MHARPHAGPGQRESLSKIEGRAQFIGRSLPRVNFGRVGGRLQPPCERFFACARSRQRQELEKRAAAEQVQVVGIHVIVVAKSLALLSASCPAVLEPGQPAFVESDAPVGHVAAAENLIVPADEPDEGCDGQQEPQDVRDAKPGEDGQEDSRTKGRKAKV